MVLVDTITNEPIDPGRRMPLGIRINGQYHYGISLYDLSVVSRRLADKSDLHSVQSESTKAFL